MTKDQKHIILHYRTDAETAKSFDIALSLFHSSPHTQPSPGRAAGWCWLWLPKDIKQIGLHKVQIPRLARAGNEHLRIVIVE